MLFVALPSWCCKTMASELEGEARGVQVLTLITSGSARNTDSLVVCLDHHRRLAYKHSWFVLLMSCRIRMRGCKLAVALRISTFPFPLQVCFEVDYEEKRKNSQQDRGSATSGGG
jgi:hypothetical protein